MVSVMLGAVVAFVEWLRQFTSCRSRGERGNLEAHRAGELQQFELTER
eukprot:SAG11_NODE_46_length_20454_cov_11.499386_11_plen_48_part_00